jgi:hypothetical protein
LPTTILPTYIGVISSWNSQHLFLKSCPGRPGWGANPGSVVFVYFLIPSLYRWATAAPQHLYKRCYDVDFDDLNRLSGEFQHLRPVILLRKWTKKYRYWTIVICKLVNFKSYRGIKKTVNASRVRIPPGCKVFRNWYIAVLLS